MALSKRSIETLIDLVEIKLSCMQVLDRDDAREQTLLESCRRELQALLGSGRAGAAASGHGRRNIASAA
ncbi:MAG: hypothetical protein ACREGL_07895 [Alphaproteobacteria bacterium]